MPWKILLFAGVSALMITALGLGFYFFSGPSQDESLGNTEFVHVIDSKLGKLDPWPADQKIDDFLFDRLEKENLQPNPTITDEQFVRRIYLSIIGRIPTIPEANDFLNSDSNNFKTRRY